MTRKLIVLLVLLVCGAGILTAQNAADKVREYAEEKNYYEAVKYIPEASDKNPDDLQLHILMGDIYMELENYKGAVLMYERADDIDGGEPPILRKLGKAYSLQGNHDKAIKILKELMEDDEDNIMNMVELGHAYIRADKLEKARLVITQAAEMGDDVPDAFLALGDLYFAQKVYELAKNYYEKALSLDESLLRARERLATAYYWLANKELDDELANEYFARSLKEWDKVTQQDPTNAKAFFNKGKILFFSARYKPAAGTLSEYVRLRPSGSLGRWYLAQSFYEAGYCDSALPHLETVQKEIDSVKTKVNFMLARCYYDLGKYNESIGKFNQLRSSGEDLNKQDMMRLASANLNSGDTLAAVGVWEEVIEMDPTQCKLAMSISQLLLKMKDYDRAISNFNRVIQNDCEEDRKASAYLMKGICYIYSEKADSSIAPLKNALETDSANLTTHIYLGDAFAKIDQPDSAKYHFEYVLEEASRDTAQYAGQMQQAFAKLSGLLLDEKNYSELKKIAKQQVNTFPEDVYANLYLAVAYQGSADIENSCRYYRRVLKLDPDNATAKKNLGALNCP